MIIRIESPAASSCFCPGAGGSVISRTERIRQLLSNLGLGGKIVGSTPASGSQMNSSLRCSRSLFAVPRILEFSHAGNDASGRTVDCGAAEPTRIVGSFEADHEGSFGHFGFLGCGAHSWLGVTLSDRPISPTRAPTPSADRHHRGAPPSRIIHRRLGRRSRKAKLEPAVRRLAI